jgi:glycosyltransferase involved in cell wall biosynthesis
MTAARSTPTTSARSSRVDVALVHDYVTQRGGAERVALSLSKAFPDAPIYTSLYDPDASFPEFRDADVRPLGLNRIGPLRRRHRLALPFLAPAFSQLEVDAKVTLCSSSGWAHGARTTGRKVVYCYTPARWLYQSDRYLSHHDRFARLGLGLLRRPLLEWDRRAAGSADRYLAISSAVSDRIRAAYGMEAEVLPAPHTIDPSAPQTPLEAFEPGFFLCVARLLPYKNVRAVTEAFRQLPNHRLVVVGTGPELAALQTSAPGNVLFAQSVADDVLRWLYANCVGVVSAAYEDFGLTPLEAAVFGKPSAVLRFGGFLDTVVERETGLFFDSPDPVGVAQAVQELAARTWDAQAIREHADRFSEERFIARIHEIVAEELRKS